MPTIVTASAAARLCNVGRKTILRRLAAGKIPGAEQALDGVWRIPVSGLRAAGLDPQAGLRSTPSLAQLQIELAEERARRVAAEALAEERIAHIRDLQSVLRGLVAPVPPEPLQTRVVAYVNAHATADRPLAVATVSAAFPEERRVRVQGALSRAVGIGLLVRVDRGLYAAAR